jgi:N-acetylmuramoyl-L-alanine amidase
VKTARTWVRTDPTEGEDEPQAEQATTTARTMDPSSFGRRETIIGTGTLIGIVQKLGEPVSGTPRVSVPDRDRRPQGTGGGGVVVVDPGAGGLTVKVVT